MEATLIQTEKINQAFYDSLGGASVVGELEYGRTKYGQIIVVQRSWLVYDKPVAPGQEPTSWYHRFFDPNETIARVNEICGGRYKVDDLTDSMDDHIKALQMTANKDLVPQRLSDFRVELKQLLDKYAISLQRSWDDDDWCEYILMVNGQEASRGTLRDLIEDLVD